jgi:hypothetical protein
MELVQVLFRFMDTDERVTEEPGGYAYYNDARLTIRAETTGVRAITVTDATAGRFVLRTKGTRVLEYNPGDWEDHFRSIASDAYAANHEENQERAAGVESRVQEQLQAALTAEGSDEELPEDVIEEVLHPHVDAEDTTLSPDDPVDPHRPVGPPNEDVTPEVSEALSADATQSKSWWKDKR